MKRDNGIVGSSWAFYDAGSGWAIELKPPYYPIKINSVFYYIYDASWPVPGGNDMIVWVLDDDGVGGKPGTILYHVTLLGTVTRGAWNEIVLSDTVTINDGSFYVAYIQYKDYPYCPSPCFDTDLDINYTWQFNGSVWSMDDKDGDFMARAIVQRSGGPAHDVAPLTINEPLPNYQPDSYFSPEVTVKNWGDFTETFDVNLKIDSLGTTIYSNTKNVADLVSGAEDLLTFDNLQLPEGNAYQVYAYTSLIGDDCLLNDTISITIKNYTLPRSQVLLEIATRTT